MSAWLVTDAHIDAMLTYANRHAERLRWSLERYPFDDTDTLTTVGMVLKGANIASVNYRYREEEEGEPYRFNFYRPITDVECVKACDCLAYQSCERDDWGASEAKRIIDAIRAVAVERLCNAHGYDAAPWGFEPLEVPA